MHRSLVLTVIGPDRPGLVEAIASAVAEHGGNWVESRMARLGGQFAGILRVHAPGESIASLRVALAAMESQGLRVHVEATDHAQDPPGITLRFELLGHDRPGIVRQVSRILAQRHVNVVDLETEVFSAPMSGEELFRAAVEATLPAGGDTQEIQRDLHAIADELGMELTFE